LRRNIRIGGHICNEYDGAYRRRQKSFHAAGPFRSESQSVSRHTTKRMT
jgi:hypothetical protein